MATMQASRRKISGEWYPIPPSNHRSRKYVGKIAKA
jgi:hypothetical protein